MRVPTQAAWVGESNIHLQSYPNQELKQRGVQLNNVQNQLSILSRSAKRSYKRACRRAQKFGQVTYRGNVLRADQCQYVSLGEDRNDACHKPRSQHANNGLHVFCYNAGGLGGGMYEELMHFLDKSHFTVALIQESKWGHDSEYSTDNWVCVGSADPKQKHAGVMIWVRKSLTSPKEIKYEAIVPGRLLRVRFPLGQQYVSAICIYQCAWHNKDPKLVQKRHGIWQALDRCVRSVPQRELLIAGGDLNTQVSPQSPYVGPGTGMLSKDRAPDAKELINVLRTNHATLLNTWSARQDEAHTFRFGTHAAQLDYIIIRQKDVNMQAKQSRPIANCPLGAWRHLGGYHIPLKASIRKRVPPPRKQATPNKKIDREQIIACTRAPDDPGNAAQIHRFRCKTQQILDSVASVQDLGNIATRVAEVAEAVFPVRKQEIVKYSNPILLSMGITNMWRQWMAIKRTNKGKSLRDMLNKWKVWAAYLRQFRAHKKQCQERKKQYLQDKMKEAELASRKHDLRSVYNIVRSLAPKAPRARTQLKGKDGGMLSRAEEAEVLRAFQAEIHVGQSLAL